MNSSESTGVRRARENISLTTTWNSILSKNPHKKGYKVSHRLINVWDTPIRDSLEARSMATAATPRFDYNIAQAEMRLGIHAGGTRNFTPVEFRVGRHTNPAGTSVKTLTLLLFAVQLVDGKKRRVTLAEFLPLFEELWEATGNGSMPPSFASHRNLYELWLIMSRNPKTLVSDCFELMACPFSVKVAETAWTNSRIQIPIYISVFVEITSIPRLPAWLSWGDSISAPIPGGFRFFMWGNFIIFHLRELEHSLLVTYISLLPEMHVILVLIIQIGFRML